MEIAERKPIPPDGSVYTASHREVEAQIPEKNTEAFLSALNFRPLCGLFALLSVDHIPSS